MKAACTVLTTILVLGVAPAYAATITVGPTGRDYTNLQTAINAAACGDVLELDEGVTFTASPFTGPAKSCADGVYVTIQSRVSDASFPATGVRVTSADDANMPIISSGGSGEPAFRVLNGAGSGHYRFKHVKFLGVVGSSTNALLAIGYGDSNQKFEAEVPRYIDVAQSRFVGHPTAGHKRGIEANGNYIFVRDSDFDDIHAVGIDNQCIGLWNAHGPLYVTNNRLECAGINFMAGGADPWVRLRMNVTGTPTTTSADVTLSDTTHDLGELNVGDLVAIAVSGGTRYTTITSAPSSGDSGTITFTAIDSAPTVGNNNIRWDEVLDGLEFKYNLVEKDPEWEDGLLDGPSDLSLSQIAGSGRSGTQCYAIASTAPGAGYGGAEIHSALGNNPCITLSGSGNVRLTFTPDALATKITIWRGTTAGTYTQFCDFSPTYIPNTSPWEDDGTCEGAAWQTFGTPPGASELQEKNLFELKSAINVLVEGNVFRNHWSSTAAPNGKAWWLKCVNQDDGGWDTCRMSGYYTFINNRIENVYGWFLIVGQERYNGAPYPPPMAGAADGTVTISNNLVCESAGHYAFTVTRNVGGTFNMEHNTVDHASSGGAELSEAAQLASPVGTDTVNTWNFRSNKGPNHGSNGYRTSVATGTGAVNAVADTVNFTTNSIADAPNIYPATTLRPTMTNWRADFDSYTGACTDAWTIAAASDEHNAGHDGTDIGVNMTTLNAATDGVVAGAPTADDDESVSPCLPCRFRFKGLD